MSQLDAGAPPVRTVADVAAEWAEEIQAPADPIRDAIQAGQTAMLLEHQRRSRYAAAQSDVLRATGEYLDELLDERGVYRALTPSGLPDEKDGAYRARGLARRKVVDPADILAAANAILAPYTAISCRYSESSDGWFLAGGDRSSGPWSSHVFNRASAGGPNKVPNYPDRRYSTLTGRRPSGAQPNLDAYGRIFTLRAPDISGLDSEVAAAFSMTLDVWLPFQTYAFGNLVVPTPPGNGFVFESTQFGNGNSGATEPTWPTTIGATVADNSLVWTCRRAVSPRPAASAGGFFVTTGSPGYLNGTFLFDFASTVDAVYGSLIGAVNAILGQSIRWGLIVDPTLTA